MPKTSQIQVWHTMVDLIKAQKENADYMANQGNLLAADGRGGTAYHQQIPSEDKSTQLEDKHRYPTPLNRKRDDADREAGGVTEAGPSNTKREKEDGDADRNGGGNGEGHDEADHRIEAAPTSSNTAVPNSDGAATPVPLFYRKMLQYTMLSVKDLQILCKAKGIATSGGGSKLVSRLAAYEVTPSLKADGDDGDEETVDEGAAAPSDAEAAPNPAVAATEELPYYMTLSKLQLRSLCRSKGILVSVTNAEVIARLEAHHVATAIKPKADDAAEEPVNEAEAKDGEKLLKEAEDEGGDQPLNETEAAPSNAPVAAPAAPTSPVGATQGPPRYPMMPVKELRNLCKSKGILCYGLKATLVARPEAHDRKSDDLSAAAVSSNDSDDDDEL